jgi:tetratricopeptide (TPR) repeat protein
MHGLKNAERLEMPKNCILGVACCCLVLSLITGCKPSGSPAKSNPAGYFQTDFQDESQFIVETIVTDLAEQIYFAKFHRLPDSSHFLVSATETADSSFATPAYELQVMLDGKLNGLKTKLSINGPIWSPEVYEGVAKMLAKAVGLPAGAVNGFDNTALLAKLTGGTATTIEKENQRLSSDLENDFSNSSLHEQAAVLLGAFALREHSGDFYEIRSPLCRITAHLTMARYLGGGNLSAINGQMAEAMLLTLMNNQAAALEKLSEIKTNDDTLVSWVRGLQARNTSDYRPLDKLDGLSEIECINWFYALDKSANTDIAWSKLNDVQKWNPDFVRIANEGGYSVGAGHELLAVSLPLEFEELSSVYQLSKQKKIKNDDLVEVLNQMPDRCFSVGLDNQTGVHVIGWGLWAGFFQRQLCHAIQQNFDFLQQKWGVPDEAKSFSTKCDHLLAGLRLYPFVRRFNCTDVASYHKSVDDGFKVTVATPQLVPARCWNFLCYWFTPSEYYHPNPNPHINEWHKHNPPPGTAYNPLPRLDHPSLTRRPDSEAMLDKLHEMAPYDGDITWYIWKTKYNSKPAYEQAVALFQPTLSYNYHAMGRVADTVEDQPEKYEQLLSKAAELNPSDYFTLADYFEQRNADKAAGYIERGNSQCPDSVLASYSASWLVKYYLQKGNTNAARHEADFAGDVYSSVGLQAKAEFLEATGDFSGAFKWFSNIEERYEDSGPVMAFCVRYKNKTGDSRYDGELQHRTGKYFPKGIEKVGLSDFQAVPADGVSINEATDLARAAGLKAGDIIVAIDGIRVHNFKQYSVAREMSQDPEMVLIVWRANDYREMKASPPGRRFGGDFGDYISR